MADIGSKHRIHLESIFSERKKLSINSSPAYIGNFIPNQSSESFDQLLLLKKDESSIELKIQDILAKSIAKGPSFPTKNLTPLLSFDSKNKPVEITPSNSMLTNSTTLTPLPISRNLPMNKHFFEQQNSISIPGPNLKPKLPSIPSSSLPEGQVGEGSSIIPLSDDLIYLDRKFAEACHKHHVLPLSLLSLLIPEQHSCLYSQLYIQFLLEKNTTTTKTTKTTISNSLPDEVNPNYKSKLRTSLDPLLSRGSQNPSISTSSTTVSRSHPPHLSPLPSLSETTFAHISTNPTNPTLPTSSMSPPKLKKLITSTTTLLTPPVRNTFILELSSLSLGPSYVEPIIDLLQSYYSFSSPSPYHSLLSSSSSSSSSSSPPCHLSYPLISSLHLSDNRWSLDKLTFLLQRLKSTLPCLHSLSLDRNICSGMKSSITNALVDLFAAPSTELGPFFSSSTPIFPLTSVKKLASLAPSTTSLTFTPENPLTEFRTRFINAENIAEFEKESEYKQKSIMQSSQSLSQSFFSPTLSFHLHHLSLNDLSLGDSAVGRIVSSMCRSSSTLHTLTRLELRGNKCGKQSLKAISKLMDLKNSCLSSADISSSSLSSSCHCFSHLKYQKFSNFPGIRCKEAKIVDEEDGTGMADIEEINFSTYSAPSLLHSSFISYLDLSQNQITSSHAHYALSAYSRYLQQFISRSTSSSASPHLVLNLDWNNIEADIRQNINDLFSFLPDLVPQHQPQSQSNSQSNININIGDNNNPVLATRSQSQSQSQSHPDPLGDPHPHRVVNYLSLTLANNPCVAYTNVCR